MNKKILIAALFLILFIVSCKSHITGSVVVDPSPAGPDGFVEEVINVPTVPQTPQGPKRFPVSGFEEKPKKYGYIIQFKEEPAVVKEVQLKETGFSASAVKEDLNEHRQKIEETQQRAISDIKDILRGKGFGIASVENLKIKKFQNVFNGIAVDVSDEVVEEIKRLSYVKAVYEDSEVHGALYNSTILINADDVWNLTDVYGKNITGQNITIAWLDSGIDYTHPDLGNCTNTTFLAGNCSKVIGGFDIVNNDSDPIDDHGHGTHTSSTAAGNGILKGVAPDAKLIAYKVLNQNNAGTWSDTIAGLDRAVDPNQDNDTSDHADVVSVIVAGSGNDPDHASSQALDNAALTGAIAVVAAGNTGPNYKTMNMPGTSRKAITVGGSDKSDDLYYYSSRGETSVGAIKPDIVAPGVSICAARHANAWPSNLCVDNQHVAISGTSMATPHVAGLVALLKQKYPNWTTAEVKMALRNTAVDIGYDHRTQGWGRVDALAAIQLNVTPCIAEFNTYNFTGAVNGTFDINGTATCANFSNYTVYYGAGKEPTSWTLINSSNASINSGILANWNTSVVQDAAYTLKLLVADNGSRVSEDRIIVNVINNQSFCFNCEDCDLKVDLAGANVTLVNDINSTNYCIWIGADNVTLDCAGHELTGSPYYQGIYVDHSNVQIKNCRVTNFDTGIYMIGAANNNLTNNSMYNNTRFEFYVWAYNFNQGNHSVDTSNKAGNKTLHYYFNQHNQIIENLDSGHIELVFSSNITVRNNNVTDGDGIRLHWTNNSVVTNNNLTKNNIAINIDGYNYDNRILNNTALNTSYAYAFSFYISHNNSLINNIISNNLGNLQSGVILHTCDNNTLTDNTVSNNDGQGIVIFRSHNNNLIDNHIFNNTLSPYWGGGGGIKIEYANNNSLINNTVLGNAKGISLYGTTSYPSSNNTILYNEISNNTQGIALESTDATGINNNISYNNIYNNTWNFNNAQVNNVTAENNWWGTTLCPNIDLKIWDYYDYNGNGVVDYTPILNGGWPGGSSVNCTIPPPACGQTLTCDINLSQSLTSNGTCFTLGANNIVLDCKGYSLTGNGSDYGVIANTNSVTIKNCKIYNFSEGVYLEGSYYGHTQQSTVDNNTFNNNSKYGIHLQYSDNNNLINNIAMNNSDKGIILQNSDYNNLTNNLAMNNSNEGILLSSSDNNNLINNTALNNIQAGFMFFYADNNNLINNSALNNVWAGFRIERSSGNDLIDNKANSDYQGILVYGSVSDPSSNNALLYNNISNNVEGIRFGSTDSVGSNNNISYNNILNNTNYDFYNDQPDNVTVENNWWGYLRCNNVGAKIYDHYDNNAKGVVDYNPILNSSWPGGSAVNCDAPPQITLISPLDKSGDADGNVTLLYNTTDETNVTNCSLIINGTVNQTDSSITKNLTQNFTLSNLSIGDYNWGINCTDSTNNTGTSGTNVLTVIKLSRFTGRTTDISQVDVENITNLILESVNKGMVNFSQVNLSGGADLDSYVNVSDNWIEINSSVLSQLNKSAVLILFNLSFTNPKILRDGTDCSSSICQILSYSGGNLTFRVTGFSSYSAAEGYIASAPSGGGGGGGGVQYQCDDNKDNDGDNLVDYPDDPGCLSRYDNNESDVVCTQSWICANWSDCIEGKQTRICDDKNQCQEKLTRKEVDSIIEIDKPSEIKDCVIGAEAECYADEDCREGFECKENKCVQKPIEIRKPEAVEKKVWPWILAVIILILLTASGWVFSRTKIFLLLKFERKLTETYKLIETKDTEKLKKNYEWLTKRHKDLPERNKAEAYQRIIDLYGEISKLFKSKQIFWLNNGTTQTL